VENIVICGHSQCGAMSALAHGIDSEQLPATACWLDQASATKRVFKTEEKSSLESYIESKCFGSNSEF